MKHRTLSLLVVFFLLCAGMSAAVLGQVEPVTWEIIEEPIDPNEPAQLVPIPQEQLDQRLAAEAARALYESFETDQYGNTLYPPDYAGHWLEDDVLVISLTTDDEAVLAHYAALTGDDENTRFQKADIPYRHLLVYRDAAMRLALDAGLRVYVGGPAVQDNQVFLEVAAQDIPAVWDVLHREMTPATFWGTGVPLPRIDDVFRVTAGEPAIPA